MPVDDSNLVCTRETKEQHLRLQDHRDYALKCRQYGPIRHLEYAQTHWVTVSQMLCSRRWYAVTLTCPLAACRYSEQNSGRLDQDPLTERSLLANQEPVCFADDAEIDKDEYALDRRFPEPFDSIFDMWAETAEELQRAHTAQAAVVDWPQRSAAQRS